MNRRWTWIRRSINPIVIDFGHHTVRMLQMSNLGRKVQVIARASRRISLAPVPSAELNRLRAEAVRDMIEEAQFLGRKVISVLPWELNAIRNLRVPRVPENELLEIVRYEACERFGFDPANSEIRYLSVGEVRQGTDLRHEVIALGASGPELAAHLQLLEELKLQTVGLDPGPCALFRSFERFLKRDEDRDRVSAIVDLGHSATRVLVARGDHPVFFKAISMGGATLDEEVGQALGVASPEANRLRRLANRETDQELPRDDFNVDDHVDPPVSRDRLRECMEPGVEQLAREIGLCLRYCSVTFRGMQTPTVYLVGGGARDELLRSLLVGQITAPVEVGRCMRDIELDVESEASDRDRRAGEPEWTTVVGAGLKSMRDQEAVLT